MKDSAVDVVTLALLEHTRPPAMIRGRYAYTCACKAVITVFGDGWEAHLGDVAVAALVGAGYVSTAPVAPVAPAVQAVVVHRYDATREARWRAAALQVCATWADPGRLPQLAAAGREAVTAWWPSLAGAIHELEAAKRALLEGPPAAPQSDTDA